MARGPLIVIEGQNRIGKAHIARIVSRELKKLTNTEITSIKLPQRDCPGIAMPWANCLTEKYVSGKLDLDVKVAHHLFSAERWRTINYVKGRLQAGCPVVLQRYVASGHVHTLAQGGVDSDWCKQFDKGLIKPDLVLYLFKNEGDDPEDEWYEPERFETPEMQKRMKELYQQFQETEDGWLPVPVTNKTIGDVSNQVVPVIKRLLKQFSKENKEFQYY